MSTLVPGQCLACDQPATNELNVDVGGVRARYPSCSKHVGMLAARMVNDTRRALAKLGQMPSESSSDASNHSPRDFIDVDSRELGQLDTAVYRSG